MRSEGGIRAVAGRTAAIETTTAAHPEFGTVVQVTLDATLADLARRAVADLPLHVEIHAHPGKAT